MEKLYFQNVEFEQNFMQFAKWYDFFAQGFMYGFQDRRIFQGIQLIPRDIIFKTE